MPAFGGQLTEDEILAVVCHERYTLGGADPTSEEYADEYETWCSEESPVFAELEAGTYDFTSATPPVMGEAEITPVGPEPIPGSSAGRPADGEARPGHRRPRRRRWSCRSVGRHLVGPIAAITSRRREASRRAPQDVR